MSQLGQEYSYNGDFGKIRLANYIYPEHELKMFYCFQSIGWHQCNERYYIGRPEGHICYLVMLTIAGEGRAVINGTEYILTPSTAIIIPPNATHEYYTPKGKEWEFYWIHPEGDLSERILEHMIREEEYLFHLNGLRKLADIFEEILFLKSTAETQYAVKASELLARFYHNLILSTQGDEQTAAHHTANIGRQLVEYIEKNYQQDLSISEISREMYLSSAYLIRTFKKQIGYTPYEYLKKFRILKAAQLLQFSDLSVGEIAKQVGFKHPSNFIHQFKQEKGVTPLVFRGER